MAKGWKCPRCSTSNGESALNCTNCGLIRGGVVVPGSYEKSAASPWAAGPEAPATEAGAWAPTEPGLIGGDGVSAQPGIAPDVGPEAPPVSAWEAGPSSKSIFQRLPWGWVLTIVLVGGGALAGLIFNANRGDTGEITKPGDLTVADLRVGDCYDLKDPTAEELDQVTARPCAEEHEYEMFFVGEVPAGSFPGAEGFLTFVDEKCLPAFEAFVGTAYADSQLDVFWLEPTEAAWSSGDRSIQCAVYDPLTTRLAGSLKGSNR